VSDEKVEPRDTLALEYFVAVSMRLNPSETRERIEDFLAKGNRSETIDAFKSGFNHGSCESESLRKELDELRVGFETCKSIVIQQRVCASDIDQLQRENESLKTELQIAFDDCRGWKETLAVETEKLQRENDELFAINKRGIEVAKKELGQLRDLCKELVEAYGNYRGLKKLEDIVAKAKECLSKLKADKPGGAE
jgi:hypothetical protein